MTSAGGILTLTPAPSNTSSSVYVRTVGRYTLDESQVHVNLRQVTASTGVALKFRVESPADPSGEQLGFWYERGKLLLYLTTGGSSQDVAALTYSPVDHAWLRIRESGAMYFWETSSDGITWVVRASRPNSAVRLPLGGVTLVFGVKPYSTTSAPGEAKFSTLNAAP